MYFKRSLSKIAKIKSFASSLRIESIHRYCHTGCLKPFYVAKFDELRKVKNSYHLSDTSRNFCIEYFKNHEISIEKSTQNCRNGIDTKTSDFRSYNFVVKSISDKEQDSASKTRQPKSTNLKICKQPLKNVSTLQLRVESTTVEQPIEKNEKKEKDNFDIVSIMASKAEICRTICDTAIASKTVTNAEPVAPISPERIIDKLTDADIEEICKTRCPCKKCHSSPVELSKTHQTNNLKKPKLNRSNSGWSKSQNDDASFVLKNNMNRRKYRLQDSSSQIRKMVLPELTPFNKGDRLIHPDNNDGNVPRDIRYELAKSSNLQPLSPIYPPTGQYNLIRTGKRFPQVNTTTGGTIHPMRPVLHRAPRELKSKYQRMIRAENKQSKHMSFKFRPVSEQRTNPVTGAFIGTRHVANSMPLPPGFQRINNRNVNPNMNIDFSQFEQFKPMPVRLRSMSNRHFNPNPVMGGSAVSSHQVLVYGNQNRRNKRTLNLPSGNVDQTKLIDVQQRTTPYVSANESNKEDFKLIENQSLVVDGPKKLKLITSSYPKLRNEEGDLGTIKSLFYAINNGNFDTTSVKYKKLVLNQCKVLADAIKAAEHFLQGHDNMCKGLNDLLKDEQDKSNSLSLEEKENNFRDRTLSVAVGEALQIVQMEYAILTNAELQHYVTGKYSPYSYATTVPGRTGSGTVEIGKDVTNVKVGDKVFVQPTSCGKCSLCLSDRRNLCEFVSASEAPAGTLSHFHVHSSEFAMKIPNNVNLLTAATSCILSSSIRACQKAVLSAGDTVMVIGGGPLSIATALTAQSMGATTVCLSDTRGPVLEEAQKIGINDVFLIDPKSPIQNTAIKIWERIGDYPRLTFDCRGSQLTNEIAMAATKTGGKVIVMTQSGNSNSSFSISNVITRDIDVVISTIGNDETDLPALRFLSAGKFSTNNVMCHYYDLSNLDDAFKLLLSSNGLDSIIIVKCHSKDHAQEKKETIYI